MSTSKSIPSVLGVYVGPETLEAILLRQADAHVEVVQRFVRQRIAAGELALTKDLALALPGLKTADDADYTLEVGDGSAAPSLLPSELAQLGAQRGKREVKGGGQAATARSFAPQLKEILQECRTLGYDAPSVAFCIAPPDVAYVELALPDDADGEKAKTPRRADRKRADRKRAGGPAGGVSGAVRKRLLEALPAHYSAPIEADRVAFLPLSTEQEHPRFLAEIADPQEPVALTLTALREQASVFKPAGRLLDAEASLYTALLAHSLKPREGERTAIVRVGTNDTLVLFLDGTQLRHLERLRSLTAYDAPETICSRVLLQQDEKRIGELQNVLLLNAGRGHQLLDRLRTYYPHAAVESMERTLADGGLVLPDDDEALLKAGAIPAMAVGLRQLQGWAVEPAVNLLPRRLQRRKRSLGVAWHTLVAALFLAAVVAGAVLRYQGKAAEAEAIRQEHLANPLPIPPVHPEVLQARVDSLNRAYATYTRALDVLDSLLVGSDRWVSTMQQVSRATAVEPDTWVDTFDAQGDASAVVIGHALSRLGIVELSRRLSGSITQLTYQDIGERRVYNYEMTIPLPSEMPRAALYLRNISEGDAEPSGPMAVRHDHPHN